MRLIKVRRFAILCLLVLCSFRIGPVREGPGELEFNLWHAFFEIVHIFRTHSL